MCNRPYAFSMIPASIPDPAFVKRNVSLAKDAGNDHQMYLQEIDYFCLRGNGHYAAIIYSHNVACYGMNQCANCGEEHSEKLLQ